MIVTHNELRASITRGTGSGEIDPATGKAKVITTDPVKAWLNWQPMTGRELDALPEGRREKRTIKGTSRNLLKVSDEFDLDGDTFEIFKVEKWRNRYIYQASKC